MSFSVDQFMQVKCTFQLTSESDSSESIHTNNEQIRLCTSVNMDNNSSALIVMVCTNETGNNHILAYYIERRYHQQLPILSQRSAESTFSASASVERSSSSSGGGQAMANDGSTSKGGAVTFAHHHQSSREPSLGRKTVYPTVKTRRAKTRPRIIVKQIYYHDYNEDIVAICLDKHGTKLVLVNASSTIYVIPIKNILLNLHAQQLKSSQGRSMYFYDASILCCAQSFADPVDVAYWESPETSKSTIILASYDGKLIYLSVEEKRVIGSTSVGEPIKSIKIMRDKFNHSLLITCKSLNQYRQALELLDKNPQKLPQDESQTVISLPRSTTTRRATPRNKQQAAHHPIDEQGRQRISWSSKPVPIRPLTNNQTGAASAANALQRVLLPSASRFGSQASLMSNFSDVRERSLPLVDYHEPTNLISLVDVLGANTGQTQSKQAGGGDPRLLRFYSDKHYYYQPQRPQMIFKLDSLDPDELITELILTERFIALTTDRDRCIVNSRNCCKLKSALGTKMDLSPLVKEITFTHEEKIMLLIKSPALNDPDNIIDSFLLVTTRSIYCIEARHGCRELFINLIDSHLAIKRTLFMSKPPPENSNSTSYSLGRMISSASENYLAFELMNESKVRRAGAEHTKQGFETRNAESNLLINSFLQHRDAYERVCHDSQAFSTLFRVDLSSLYETYADRLLQRGQFELANRFFQMAAFDHIKILGKYIRVGAYRETIDYVKGLMMDESDFRRFLEEGERIELSKIAFECLLAKTIVERCKTSLYRTKSSPGLRKKLFGLIKEQLVTTSGRKQQQSNNHPELSSSGINPALRGLNPFRLCEHSPKGQDAKLSATTIVLNGHDDEDTLTSNAGVGGGGDSVAVQNTNVMMSMRSSRAVTERTRLECEKSFLDFIRNLMPSPMFEYTIDQLLDFDLIEFIDMITQTDTQILAFIKLVIRYRDEDRLVFRAGRFEPLLNQLTRAKQADLIKVSTEKEEFLEFLTSQRVTRALVKDIGLTCEYYGYQHTLVQFRKYSFAALRHLETYRQLIKAQSDQKVEGVVVQEKSVSSINASTNNFHSDENANDGLSLIKTLEDECPCVSAQTHDGRRTSCFGQQQKQNVENIFIEFLTACLDESTEDSCRLWYSYINFYLNYVGSLDDLQSDILRMIENIGDCRLSISLYRAIHRDESLSKTTSSSGGGGGNSSKRSSNPKAVSNFKIMERTSQTKMPFLRENIIANTPLEAMRQLYSLHKLFKNEFLMRLLDKTLDLMPQSADLNALSIANMC